jgi:GH24 family phage-related lysozyme (muramidase)
MKVSEPFIPFLTSHEGYVSKAYRDSGGVWTIAVGATMFSKVFSEFWLRTRGHRLRIGDTITRAESDQILKAMLDEEYSPPVGKRFGEIPQNQFDASVSVTYNCGPGTLKDRWATALASGLVKQAARLLRSTRVTAGGKRLKGLVRRRSEEAALLEFGDYGQGSAPASVSLSGEEVADYQRQLAALGYYTDVIDGRAGDKTKAAVRAFQNGQGLVEDGIVGPATRAALKRALDSRTATKGTAGGAVAGGGAGAGTAEVVDPGQADLLLTALYWGLLIGGIVLALFILWRFRGVILRRRTYA